MSERMKQKHRAALLDQRRHNVTESVRVMALIEDLKQKLERLDEQRNRLDSRLWGS